MTPILRRLAAEKNGTVESPSLFLMPKLRFSHSGAEVEVCGASTGIDRMQADLLSWAEQQTDTRINDIRNCDDKLIFAVTGTLKNYEEYTLLLDTACRFYDALTKVVSNYAKVLNDI